MQHSEPINLLAFPNWKSELRRSLTRVEELERAGLLLPHEASQLHAIGDRFKIRITPYYAGLMSPDPGCPIRLQAIPGLGEEDPVLPENFRRLSREFYGRNEPWTADAIGDLAKLAAPRLTHRYDNRAILHLASNCAVFCRFCFRKAHLADSEEQLYSGTLEPAWNYLAEHSEIRELILTGGDPLSVSDEVLERTLERAAAIPHLRLVRIHSRMPVTLPERITPELIAMLARISTISRANAPRLSIALVSHFNHPRELTALARASLDRLHGAGVALYNQSVLLRRINDDPETLESLFQALYEWGVRPFYLHHTDWTPGTFQFRLGIERGLEIYRALRGRLSGPALPQYVLDLPQGGGKVSLTDPGVRRLETLVPEAAIAGALWELAPPTTRAAATAPVRYLDLFPNF